MLFKDILSLVILLVILLHGAFYFNILSLKFCNDLAQEGTTLQLPATSCMSGQNEQLRRNKVACLSDKKSHLATSCAMLNMFRFEQLPKQATIRVTKFHGKNFCGCMQ